MDQDSAKHKYYLEPVVAKGEVIDLQLCQVPTI